MIFEIPSLFCATLRQSNRPYFGSSTSFLWTTFDPGTLVCYWTGAQMLLWMDVATMITRVMIARIRTTMMIHSWCKWWETHLKYRSSHSSAEISRCHLNSWICLLFPLVSVLMKDCQPNLNRWIHIFTKLWNSACISMPYYFWPRNTFTNGLAMIDRRCLVWHWQPSSWLCLHTSHPAVPIDAHVGQM